MAVAVTVSQCSCANKAGVSLGLCSILETAYDIHPRYTFIKYDAHSHSLLSPLLSFFQKLLPD
jgi:hypothetical protein